MPQRTDQKTICWNAIVKNESAIIERCMSSMVGQIDYWVVVDTGSTDGTQQIIKDFMAKHKIPGELFERPWVNFSHNRSEALELAENKADYIFLCDADMTLEVLDPEWKSQLQGDPAYSVIQKNSTLRYSNIRLVNGRLTGRQRYRYWGATHEYCDSIEGNNSPTLLTGIELPDFTDGGSKGDKYARDAKLLMAEIKKLKALEKASDAKKQKAMEEGLWDRKEELIRRCTFYLAQTWRDSDQPKKALDTYKKRIALGGWVEEVYYSLLQVAKLKAQLNYPLDEVQQAFLAAYEYRPQRAESLYFLARYLRLNNRIKLAYIYAMAAISIPLSTDKLFVNYPIYEWKAKDELAVSAYWVKNYHICYALCVELLENPTIPEQDKQRIQKNLAFAKEHL